MRNAGAEGFLGPRVGGEGAEWTSSPHARAGVSAPRVSGSAAAPSRLWREQRARGGGGPSQPRSLGVRGAGCWGGGPLPKLSYRLPPAWPGGQPVVRQRQRPLTNSGPMITLLPGSWFGTPDTPAEQVWLLESNHQMALPAPFSQSMSESWRPCDNSSPLRSPLGSTNSREERRQHIELTVRVVKITADSLTRVEETCWSLCGDLVSGH